MSFIFRDHPQSTKQKRPSQINESDEIRNQEQNVTSNEGIDLQEDMEVDEEPFDFENERKLILEDVFASVMKIKIQHSVCNEAIDGLLNAMKDASAKSNLLFKKKLKEAISSQIRKQEIMFKSYPGSFL